MSRAHTLAQISSTLSQVTDALDALDERLSAAPFQITIPASGWALDAEEATDYKYYTEISVTGIEAWDVAEITLARGSYSTARLCGLCRECETLAGKIRLRAQRIPAAAMAATCEIRPGREPAAEEEEEEESA